MVPDDVENKSVLDIRNGNSSNEQLSLHLVSEPKQSKGIQEREMSDDKTLTKIPQFDGHYDHWSELMENLLRAKGLWSLVKEGYTEPAAGIELNAAQKELKMKDCQVKHYLF
ncbi:hypothetical protein KIW84_030992 [Lathyrus oleraceus]|uniref:Retrovirus-related Pol polyprotein from transposon TNT 1-94 n=1 Tax=Pisum sativum TaxID=3888 RepID=A0A9D4XPL7_PEA|nr:hypothetical protein KIW84_030992 [Pisum sativum]